MTNNISSEIRHYIEDYGVFAAAYGLPRMAGKILGWLTVCSPPHQTAEEIETALGVSTGTVSTMTRLLLHTGLIEKKGIPGQRRAHFRVKDDVWAEVVSNELIRMRQLRELAERGLVLLANTPPENRQRLHEMREMFAFAERIWPTVIERFHDERSKNQ